MSDRFAAVPAVVKEATEELKMAMGKYPAFKTTRDAVAVIDARLNLLSAAIGRSDKLEAYHRAKQVAAMALRFMADCNSMKVN